MVTNALLDTNAECTVEFRKNPYVDILEKGEPLVLYARLVAGQLPNVLTLKCTANYIYGQSNDTKEGIAWAQKTYCSTTPGNIGGGRGGNNGNSGNKPRKEEPKPKQYDPKDDTPTSTYLKGNDGQPTTAKVSIAFSQTLTLTRQAFLGTLTINNKEEVGLEDIVLNLTITNTKTGEVATEEMIVRNLETLQTFGQHQVTGNMVNGIDVSHLQPGAYILKIVATDGLVASKKFIKA